MTRTTLAIAAACIAVATSSAEMPSDSVSHHLIRGTLVGIRFSIDHLDPKDVLPDLHLQFQIHESFNGPFTTPDPGDRSFVMLRWRDDVDFSSLDRDSYDATMTSLLPTGVALGDDCLVDFTWIDTEKRAVEVERVVPGGEESFLRRNAAKVVPRLASQIDRAFEHSLPESRAALRRVVWARERNLENAGLARSLWGNRYVAMNLRSTRRTLAFEAAGLRRTAALVERLRDAADPEMRDLADRSLVAVPSILAQAEAFDRQLLVAARLDPYWAPFVTTYTEEEVRASFK